MAIQAHTRSPPKGEHPSVPELVGSLDLSPQALSDRPDASQLAPLTELLSNADYWLSFDLATFEPMLQATPSPLREIAIGVALRFGNALDGKLRAGDIESFGSTIVETLPEDLHAGLQDATTTLARTVLARDSAGALAAEGFEAYQPAQSLSVHALRASGRSTIHVDGAPPGPKLTGVEIGRPIELRATDERGHPLEPPEIESRLGAPILAKSDGEGLRTAIFLIPGRYRLRVPGRAEGDRRVLAR